MSRVFWLIFFRLKLKSDSCIVMLYSRYRFLLENIQINVNIHLGLNWGSGEALLKQEEKTREIVRTNYPKLVPPASNYHRHSDYQLKLLLEPQNFGSFHFGHPSF